MNYVEQDIRQIKGIGEKKAQLFNKLGIFTVEALVSYYPRQYEDWSQTVRVVEAHSNETCCIKATLITDVQAYPIRRGMTLYKCNFTDGDTVIHVTIFNNQYLAASLKTGEVYLLFGKVEKTLLSASMASPRIEKAVDGECIRPIYPSTQGLTSRMIELNIKSALDAQGTVRETLPTALREAYSLISLDSAVHGVHFPAGQLQLEQARHRLVFEELLVLQIALMKLKKRAKSESTMQIQQDYSPAFFRGLPFAPTNAQKRVVAECIADLRGELPLNRLVQGDVGSGKTAVAAALIHTLTKNGFQCAMMAPTEILAKQHYQSLKVLLKGSGVRASLLTGSTTATKKKTTKLALMNGGIDLLIGTHALIQNDVEFQKLGLIITDEQHRFGVKQRAALAEKGTDPHTLVMTATPIPRTLAMMIYGDLELSVIDEMPKGRQIIDTFVVKASYHHRVYTFIKKSLDEGHQAYIVCPMVEEGDSELTSAKAYAQQLQQTAFSGYRVGLLHGKMKAKEKESVMADFMSGKIQLLVSTTVVEVGVDVPNAVIMLVENADRFGLSQLHQLRGRVGRGTEKSYCILISDNDSAVSIQRLAIMKSTNDGFVIADEDLKLRGPGDFFGHRQHGLPDLKIADMLEDISTLQQAQSCAKEILAQDIEMAKPDHQPLLEEVLKLFAKIKE